jgi:predicted Zn-dependent protease with MMP-like domain
MGVALKLADVVREVLAEMPPEAKRFVADHVHIEVRDVPTDEDIARGADPDDRGYFYGRRLRGDGELEDVEEWYADEDDDVAEVPEAQPGGVVVLFLGNIRPLTRAAVTDVLLHELAHAFGEDEDDVVLLGLDDAEDAA